MVLCGCAKRNLWIEICKWNNKEKNSKMKETNIGKYAIVRGNHSGVFAGILTAREGQEVQLTNCRRIWYWDGAASISQLAAPATALAMVIIPATATATD